MRPSICLAAALMISLPASAQSTDSGAARAPAPVRVELPEGWKSKTPTVKGISQYAEYPGLVAYFQLVLEPRSDFADSVDLMAWAKLVKENSAKTSKLANRKDTELRERKVGDRATVEYEVTGEIRGVKLRYRNIMVQSGDHYCKLVCWTTPSHWEEAQAKFDELVGRLK
jgi:hypothetical protein